MGRSRVLSSVSFAACLAVSAVGAQQTAAVPSSPHTVVVRLIERPGALPFAFDPAVFTAERGDTLRFVQFAATMHNVHFKVVPKGANLGAALSGPYLTTKGQTYSIVVDARFPDGKYELICDPHEMIGMHAFLNVSGSALLTAARK
jgi:plastocyanin